MKIYIAGPLFSAGDIKQRLYEEQMIKEFDNSIKIYNPISAPVNDKSSNPTSEDIFIGDMKEIDSSDVIFFDLSTEDPGTILELGLVLNSGKKLYPVYNDIRLGGKVDQGYRAQIGFNQFVVGAILKKGFKIFTNFEDAFETFKKDNFQYRKYQ